MFINKSLKHLLTIVLLLVISTLAQAQIIDNRLNIFLGYDSGITPSRETVTNQGIVLTSLMGNLETWSGIKIKGYYMVSPSLGFGLSISDKKTISQKTHIYRNSELNHSFFAGLFKYQNHNPSTGLFNRIYFFGSAGPALGLSSLTLRYPIMDVVYNGSEPILPMSTTDLTLGMVLNGGVELIIHPLVGIYVGYSFDVFHVNSPFYPDRVFTRNSIDAGIFLRVKANKRYYYY